MSIAWRFTWGSSCHSDFKYDFHVSFLPKEIAAARVTACKMSRAIACTSYLVCNGTIEEHHDPRSA